MELTDIYDSLGQDGKDNKDAFERLPSILQYFVSSQQKALVCKVVGRVRQIYGDDGLKHLVKTSGFRSNSVTSRHGGVSDSLHHYGCAADFRKTGIFANNPIPTCCDLECIDSGKVWHIQYKRGVK